MPNGAQRRSRSRRPAPSTDLSLADFMRNKLKAKCPVCQLPERIRSQLGPAAAKKGYTRADQVEWLHAACNAPQVTLDMLNAHFNQRHEPEGVT